MYSRQYYTIVAGTAALILCALTQKSFASEALASTKAPVAWQANLQKRINYLIDRSKIKRDELGLWVTNELNGKIDELVTLNGERGFIPASLTKVATAATALKKFPVGHQFLTQLASSAKVEDGQLKGDLFLRGGGDSGFVSETMWFLVNEFVRNEIREIQGDIVVDESRFDGEHYPSGRDPQRVDRAYDAPVSAMSFNWNSVNVYVRPGKKGGDPAQVFIDPANDYILVDNKAKTTGGRKDSITVSRIERKGQGDTIMVRGTIGLDSPEVVDYKSVSHPGYWSGHQLRAFLAQRNIGVKGKVRLGNAPKEAKVLAQAKSQPVAKAVADMMKFSNNYVAEMLTKSLAAEVKGAPGTMEAGMTIVRDFLVQTGLSPNDFVLTNPSGLSRKNRLRPKDLHKILMEMQKDFRLFPEFLSSLPIAGVDGTLKDRLKKAPAAQWIRAKTGLLDGVVGLAGYAGRADGSILTFVFLYNGSPSKMYDARAFLDEMALALVQ